MDFFNSKRFIIILVVFLVCVGMFGCAKPKQLETQGPDQPTTLETISKMDSIATALGCMFAPNSCKEENVKDKPDQGENN